PRLPVAVRGADLKEEPAVECLEGVDRSKVRVRYQLKRGDDVVEEELGAGRRTIAAPQLPAVGNVIALGPAGSQEEEGPIDVGEEPSLGVAGWVDVLEHEGAGPSAVAAPYFVAVDTIVGGEVFNVTDGGDFRDRAPLR